MTPKSITPEMVQMLMESAADASRRAYVPYSHFPVGAAILVENGEIIVGCNVENASYPLSVCAERVAVTTAMAAGHRVILAVAVTAPKVDAVTPCGGCRQVLNEFKPKGEEMLVLLGGPGRIEETTLGALLPRSFGPADLEDVHLGSKPPSTDGVDD